MPPSSGGGIVDKNKVSEGLDISFSIGIINYCDSPRVNTMPTYDIKNSETGEEKEVIMSYDSLQVYLDTNPEWKQVHKSASTIVTHTGSILGKTSDGWKDVLKSVKKASGRKNTINV